MTSFLSGLTGSFSLSAAENPTVAVMEAGYGASNLDVRYINCEVAPEKLAGAVSGAIAMGWLGFNCSLPHKEAILEYLDDLAPSARLIGAVNTVVIKDGRLIGENTDGKGFVEALKTIENPQGSRTVIFGAGGAARAIAIELALAGAQKITIVNRSPERGKKLAQHVDSQTEADCSFADWTAGYSIPEDSSLVVNATSLGFYPNHEQTLDVDFSSFTPGSIVADVVANPPKTRWLQAAETAGCVSLTGIGMLVNQARVNAQLWTGETLDAEVMHRALNKALGLA
jgi:shikimate dehydrogenase|tara:strand:- start:3556 stop:4407 length:852 start_codon:yes stop_codon:yes gene_type:complete